MTPEQTKFIAVLTALYPEGIAVEEYPMIIEAAELSERCQQMIVDIEIEKEVEKEIAEESRYPKDFIDAKSCAECLQVLPFDQFYKQAKAPDGLRKVCKKCKPHRGRCSPSKQPSSAQINKVRAKARVK